jgi:5-methylthioadenosine/S-adenosylhomocysteine deaminase
MTAAPVPNGTVAVEGNRIAYVGTRAHAPPGEDRELGSAILLPGLVNAHTHLELTVMRGFLEGLAFRDWIVTLQRAKLAVLDTDRLLDSVRAGIAEGLRNGITCYADTCDSGVALRAMREVGVRGIMYQEVFGPEPEQCDESMAALAEKITAHRGHEDALRAIGVSPHAPYTVSDALYERVARYASDENLPIAVHIAESAAEQALVCDGAGPFADGWRRRGIPTAPRARSPIELLARLGVLGSRTLAIHCVQATEPDIASLASSDTAVAHCPISNAKLGHGIAPISDLMRAGLRIGLGSDSMASNNRMHLLEEARSAVLAQNVRQSSPCALTAEDALAMATIGGAKALGLDDRIGSLEPGKEADLAAFPLGDAAAAAEHDPIAAAVWSLGNATASTVVVNGVELVLDGVLLNHDPDVDTRVLESSRLLAEWRARFAEEPGTRENQEPGHREPGSRTGNW